MASVESVVSVVAVEEKPAVSSHDSFCADLEKSVRTSILALVRKEFEKAVVKMHENPQLKSTASYNTLVEIWNTTSEYKLPLRDDSVSVDDDSKSVASESSAKGKTTRAKPDKTRTCTVVMSRGKNAGNPCGANCVLGVEVDMCSTHYKASQKPATKPSKASEVSKDSDGLPSPVDSSVATGCQQVLASGERKGQFCNGKITKDGMWCTPHGKKH